MAPIEKDHLIEVEFLFSQSAKGIHLLFDHNTLAAILSQPTDDGAYFSFENMTKVQNVLSSFIEQRTLAQKKDFLATLNRETYELLVRTYFNIVENSIFESSEMRH